MRVGGGWAVAVALAVLVDGGEGSGIRDCGRDGGVVEEGGGEGGHKDGGQGSCEGGGRGVLICD